MRAFVEAVVKEAHYYGKKYDTPIKTLYLGGGTPSMLSPTHLRRLFEGLNSAFDLSQITELTFEANPATFDLKKAQLFKELGITRISLGIQSFSNRVLKTLGREHDHEQAIESVGILREAGIPEVNIDLMFAIPGQPLDEWEETLRTAVSLKPDHISSYNLTYEEDTEFIDKLTNGEYVEDEETNARYFEISHQLLTEAGFLHYETSNYAKPGFESRHNQSYWAGAEYLGLGPSGVGTVDLVRWKNVADTARYIEMINHVGHAQTDIEELSRGDFRIERIALQLRTTTGLPEKWLEDSDPAEVQLLIDEKLASRSNGHLTLINNGPMLVDSIAERLV